MRHSASILFVLGLFLAFASCQGGGKNGGSGRTYFVVVHGAPTDTFRNVVQKGMNDAAAVHGASVTYLAPASEDDQVAIQANFQQAIDAKPDGIIVTVHDYLATQLANARTAHIPIIAINSPPSVNRAAGVGGEYLFYIGQKEYEAGAIGGQKLQVLAAAQGATIVKAICVEHANLPNLDQRCAGLQSVFGDKYDKVAIYDDLGQAQSTIRAYFTAHPGTIAALGLGPEASAPLIGALDGFDVIAGTFDSSDATVAGVRSGALKFYIDQQPYLQSYLAVEWMELYLNYGLLPAQDELTGPGFVDQNNIDAVTSAIKAGAR
jgi:simple sugar transport system substrate-binding protein